MLVRKIDDSTGRLYAMKTLRKAALLKRNQVAHTATERYILQKLRSPFLVHLVYAFQTSEKLYAILITLISRYNNAHQSLLCRRYMVLNYMPGGELFFWLKKDRRFSEPRARLYAAEMTLALETMHAANIIYRYVSMCEGTMPVI